MVPSKPEKYRFILEQARHLWDPQIGLEGNLCNVLALVQKEMQFWWIGFYKVALSVEKESELHLHVFTGPVACTRIAKGKGVCGTVWEKQEPIIVPNVHAFPGHIACSSESQSELVIPVSLPGSQPVFWGVLDVDSTHLNHFDSDDLAGLTSLVDFISLQIPNHV